MTNDNRMGNKGSATLPTRCRWRWDEPGVTCVSRRAYPDRIEMRVHAVYSGGCNSMVIVNGAIVRTGHCANRHAAQIWCEQAVRELSDALAAMIEIEEKGE